MARFSVGDAGLVAASEGRGKVFIEVRIMRGIKFILLLLLAFGINAEAQNKVGMIVGITGTAQLKEINGKVQKLNARNFAVSLSVGQSLRADDKSKVQIKLCNEKNETIGNKWFIVSQVICSSTTNSEKRKVLENIFDFGGRYKTNRGDDDFILFPLEKEITIIRPETAVFRWKLTPEKRLSCSVNLVGQDKPIWKREVDGEPKSFTSDEFKKLLADIRQKQPDAKLQLKLSIAFLGTENSAVFQIFSLPDEENLQKELAETNSEQGIFRHLARAEIYSRYKLYNEVANEYEEALKLSPESIELLTAATSAQDRAGNFNRRNEIDVQIKALKK